MMAAEDAIAASNGRQAANTLAAAATAMPRRVPHVNANAKSVPYIDAASAPFVFDHSMNTPHNAAVAAPRTALLRS